MTIQSDAQLEFISDTIPSSNTYIAARQPTVPGTSVTFTNTEFSNGSTRQITVTAYTPAPAGYGSFIQGTDANDEPIVEIITFPLTPGIPTTGNLYFKTIINAFAGGGTEISIGMSNRVVQTIPGRIRLKGYSVAYGPLSGAVAFYDGVINMDTDLDVTPLSFTTYTYDTINLMINFQIPGDGILYKNGLGVSYENGVTSNTSPIRMMNLFYG